MKKPDRPRALLVQPPIYDFALFDLFLKPYGLLRVGRWLAEAGWEVAFVNGLDYEDPVSAAVLPAPKRQPRGRGNFSATSCPRPRRSAAKERGPSPGTGSFPRLSPDGSRRPSAGRTRTSFSFPRA